MSGTIPPEEPRSAPTAPGEEAQGAEGEDTSVLSDEDLYTMEEVKDEWREAREMSRFASRLAAERADEVEYRGRMFRIRIGIFIGYLIFYFAGSVYVQRLKYPVHFEWYERVVAPIALASKHQYSMYQTVVAAYYPEAQSLMNTFAIWPELPSKGARFLMQCVQHFEVMNEKTRGKLSALHWAGEKNMTNADRLFGKNGWLSGCQQRSDFEARKAEMKKNWLQSRDEGNIWFDFFPDPSTDEESFFKVGIIQQLFTDESCGDDTSIKAYANVYKLYDGGLCNIARLKRGVGQGSSELFYFFFGSPVRFTPATCNGEAADAAKNGATAAGLAGFLYMDAFEPISAVSGHNKTGVIAAAGSLGIGAVGAGVGYAFGRAAGNERCA